MKIFVSVAKLATTVYEREMRVGASHCVLIMQIRAKDEEGLRRRSNIAFLAASPLAAIIRKKIGKERDCSHSTKQKATNLKIVDVFQIATISITAICSTRHVFLSLE